MPSILSIDQGTTGSTALVVHQDGTVLGRGYREFTQHFPRPGWVEHDADEIFRVSIDAAREAIGAAGELPAALGISNQRETVVLWDRATLAPVGRAIVWQDRRTTDRCRELYAAGMQPLIRERTGLVLDPYFSATKLEWMLHEPDVRRRAERGQLAAGTIDSWLIARLTRGRLHVTDRTNASRTMLAALGKGAWDDELLALFSVPRSILPEIVGSSDVVGHTDPDLLGAELPVAGIAGDQQSALFGQACVRAGMAKNTYGTGAFLLLHTGDTVAQPPAGVLATAACGPRGEAAFALEGSVLVAGAAMQWLRDGLGLIENASESEALARSVPDTAGVHFVPAFAGLGTPHWSPDARGTITGLTRGTTRAHLVRAALESMAFASADLLEAMERPGTEVPSLRVDGGASANDWLMQFQADVIGRPVERPVQVETTALGAAALAGISTGIWRDADDFASSRAPVTFEPSIGGAERKTLRRGWQRAINAALAWARDSGA